MPPIQRISTSLIGLVSYGKFANLIIALYPWWILLLEPLFRKRERFVAQYTAF